MLNFWEVLFSPVAINKFLHTVQSGYVLAAVFVIGVSSWFLLKKRETCLKKEYPCRFCVRSYHVGIYHPDRRVSKVDGKTPACKIRCHGKPLRGPKKLLPWWLLESLKQIKRRLNIKSRISLQRSKSRISYPIWPSWMQMPMFRVFRISHGNPEQNILDFGKNGKGEYGYNSLERV